MNKEKLYRDSLDALEKSLENLKHANYDQYLKTLGELEKVLRDYLFGKQDQ